MPPFTEPSREGSTGSNVQLIQEALNALASYYPGRLLNQRVDGIFGYKTKNAVYAFQSIANIQITGVVNEVTWDTLMNWMEPPKE